MRPSLIASPLSLLLAVSQVMPSFGLYFYIDGVHPKCFFEELPKDTLVVGRSCIPFSLVFKKRFLRSNDTGGGRDLGGIKQKQLKIILVTRRSIQSRRVQPGVTILP